MSFLSPYFLIGLAAVAVPLLVHLLTRDRVRREAFSTLRFFAKVSRKVLRRKRFREMLLLVLRAAVCGLLVLAFARPYLKGREADELGAAADTARVILVDVSASMARQGMAATAAREAAEALASLSPATDVAALITFADVPRVEAPLSARFDEVRSRLKSLAPGHGGTDVAEAVRKADAVLGGAAARKKEIVLVSDLQRAGWRSFKGDWKLAAGTRLTIRPVAPPAASDNLAIIEADYPASTAMDGLPRTVAVRVANFSVQDRRDVEVALAVAGRKVDTQKVHIRPGESVPVRFRHVFSTAGDNPGAVTVAGADAAPDDNVYYFNTRVIPRIRVAVVSGPPAGVAAATADAGRAQDAGFFIEKALAPVPESPFLVKRVATAQARPEDLADVQVAILADVKEVPPAVVKALGDLLARGGGILFLPGQQVQADTFGQVFGALVPCKLRGVIRPGGRAGDAPGAVLAKVDFEHPVFEVFQHPHYGDLTIPRFRQFWEVGDSQLSRVLARFDDGKPAVLEREIGGGVSMMLASPVDLRWNNFPLRAVFLPYLHQTVRYLAVRSEKRTGYLVGETLPVPEGRKVTDPKGEALSAGSAVATLPGFYAVSGSGPADAFQFAVNRDPAEADPASVAPEEIAAAVQGAEAAIAEAGEAAGSLTTDRDKDDQGLWWYLLAGVIGLTAAELFVANRTMRH